MQEIRFFLISLFQPRYQQISHSNILREDQSRFPVVTDGVQQFKQTFHLTGCLSLAMVFPITVRQHWMITDLLELGQGGQNNPLPGNAISAVQTTHQIIHHTLVQHRLLRC
ncbi:hypothetical protein D3C74_337620 [compost metagenome]